MSTKITFAEIVRGLRHHNMAILKNRAFIANQVAKITVGRSQRAAYSVKDRSIRRLLTLGEAQILRHYGRPIGVRFRTGGQLHLRRLRHLNDASPSADRAILGRFHGQAPVRGRAL